MSETAEADSPSERWLVRVLRLVGVVSLWAFGAAVMPRQWIVEASEWLGFEPFPDSPLTFYLARNLSLLYGYVGGLLIVVSCDVPRYRPLIRWIALGTLSFGLLQLVVDSMSGLPVWWTWGESLSTIGGGILLWWLVHRSANARASGNADDAVHARSRS